MNPGSVENFVAVVLYIGAGLCALTALGYLLGMLSCLVRRKREKKPHYNFIIGFPPVLVSLLWIYPYNRHVINCALISLAAWLFALACAAIQEKAVSGLDWRAFEDKTLDWIFGGIGRLRAALARVRNKWMALSSLARKLIVIFYGILFLAELLAIPQGIPAILLLNCFLWLLISLHSCIHSCRKLLRLWFLESLTAILGGAGIVLGWLPDDVLNPLIVYGTCIVLFLATWTVSVGIADYDTAKLTCRAVNTGTTILLLLLNILPTAASKTGWAGQFFEARLDDWFLSVNVILLPLVFSGYLAALFVEAQNYFWSHKKKRKDDGKKPVEPGSTA